MHLDMEIIEEKVMLFCFWSGKFGSTLPLKETKTFLFHPPPLLPPQKDKEKLNLERLVRGQECRKTERKMILDASSEMQEGMKNK